ncbi:RNA polymerase sigma factor [Pseudophaeobacter arcticus]|uniref:RNA polymerase sigma factor n=1 Tax=Pseudophaeobacter arcticus TaxID=385492 RepID=UPI003A96A115
MIIFDPVTVEAARQGSRAALEELINAASGPVFNLAMRMLAHRQDAEDATQEILIKIITHLGDLREMELAGAWAFRIATRHLAKTARLGRVEKMRWGFKEYTADLDHGQADPAHLDLTDAEHQLALKEVKVGCTLAMLVCLSRPLRIAYILGEIFEMTDTEACDVLEIPAGTYRQRLRRARNSITDFMQSTCSIHSAAATCSCARRITPALQTGRIAKGITGLNADQIGALAPKDVQRNVANLETAQRSVSILRSNPRFVPSMTALVEQILHQFP